MSVIKVLFITNTIVLFSLTIYLLYKWKHDKHYRALKLLAIFIASYFIGHFLLILRNQIPDFFSIVVANTFFAIGSLNLYVATKAILNLDSKWYNRYYVPIVIIFLSFILFTYIDFNTSARIMIYYSFVTIYSFFSFYLFWFYRCEKFVLLDKITAIFFFIGVVNSSFMVLRVFMKNITSYYFGNLDLFIYSAAISMLFFCLWIILLVKYRIKN
jgi:hypothetical protein